MSIRIVNLRTYKPIKGEVLIKIDRSSPVGNPFPMSVEGKRDKVCDQYQTYFNTKITTKGDAKFMGYLRMIYQTALHNDVALGCWCTPKRCHGETIKAYVDEQLKRS